MQADTIISLSTIYIYTALGVYFLKKNPRERINRLFALFMLIFVIWSFLAYDTGIANDLNDTALYIKIELIGLIVALAIFVFYSISLLKEKILQKPLIYLILVPSIYLIYLVWTLPMVSEQSMFIANTGIKKEFFLFSTVFGVAGIYLLLRYYMASKYRQHEQTKLILAGAIASIITAITANIVLPMFFNRYISGLSTFPPAVLGIFFAYSIYQYGLFIRPMPEVSVSSFCGTECTVCPEFKEKRCKGCKLDRDLYKTCEPYLCSKGKEYSGCGDCFEIISCEKRKAKKICLSSKPEHELKSGSIYLNEGDGYNLFLNAVRTGSLGIIVTAQDPEQLRDRYDLNTIPIVWLSDESFDKGVRPDDLKRLGIILINFMKKIENIGKCVVLLEATDMLISINGFEKVIDFIKLLNSTARSTNSSLIISDKDCRIGKEIEHQDNYEKAGSE